MNVRCLHRLAEIAPLRDAINALNLAAAHPDPFSTYEYYENLLLHARTRPGHWRNRAWFLAVFADDRLVGYLALKQTTTRVLLRQVVTLGFLVGHDTDRPHVVATAADTPAVTAAIYEYLARRGDWDLLELQQQDAKSTLYPLPCAMRRCRVKDWPTLDNFTIPIRWRTLPAYFQSLAKKFRSEVRRGIRKLSAAGKLDLLTATDPAGTPILLELYLAIEAHSWKSQANLTLSGDASRLRCVRGLLNPRQPMRIVIQILSLGGIPIAGLICGSFASGGCRELYALHVAYDDRCSELAPGSAILLLGLRYAIEGGYALFNWLSGFGYYKTRWLAEETPTRAAQIYRIGRIPYWCRLLGDSRRWLKRRLGIWTQHGQDTKFNPARRQLLQNAASDEPVIGSTTTAVERERFATLSAQARSAGCEHVSTAELADALPFSLRAHDASGRLDDDTSAIKRDSARLPQSKRHNAAQAEQLADQHTQRRTDDTEAPHAEIAGE